MKKPFFQIVLNKVLKSCTELSANIKAGVKQQETGMSMNVMRLHLPATNTR